MRLFNRSHPQARAGHNCSRRLKGAALRVWLAILGALALGGCAGSQEHLRLLEADHAISVMPASAPDHDFVVSIRNLVDVGYDPDDKATRDRTALQFMQAQCPRATIVGETAISTGSYMGGRASKTYAIKIKCN